MDKVTLQSLFLLNLFYISSSGHATFLLNRTIRQSCGDRFECSSGRQCIEPQDVCNGITQCQDGSDEKPRACGCGLSRQAGQVEAGVHDARIGNHPWHVGIYKSRLNDQHTLLCSGALIYSDIVLTSANCVFDPDTYQPYSESALQVGAGKVKRDFTINESSQQKFNVSKILVLPRYDGDKKGFARNLAVIKLKTFSQRTLSVLPICIWWSRVLPKEINTATITGWGLQFSGHYANNLRQASAPFFDSNVCARRFVDPLFKRFLTNDKFCVTFEQGVGQKDDDNGGPVTIFKDGVHYLIGILSARLYDADFGLVTKISKHADWIKNTTYHLKKNEECLQGKHFNCESDNMCIGLDKVCNGRKDCYDGSDEDDIRCNTVISLSARECYLPDGYHENYEIVKCGGNVCNVKSLKIPTGSTVRISCSPGYGFQSPDKETVQVVCSDGKWFPPLEEWKCLRLCPPLDKKSLDLSCFYLGNKVKCDDLLKPNTTIQIKCKHHYKVEKGTTFSYNTFCRKDGELHKQLVECIPDCGQEYHQSAEPQISLGVKLEYAKYPWHVALYHKQVTDNTTSYVYQCGGSLIDINKIVTAAHCIWNEQRNTIMTEEDVAVALGKYQNHWLKHDPGEQKFGIKKIYPGEYYNGQATRYSQDIAILVLNKDVELSSLVMPVCLDLDNSFGGIPSDVPGLVIGWGKDERGVNTDVLHEAYMDYLELENCRKRFEVKLKQTYSQGILNADKFCGLYRNGSGTQKGDSGGGITWKHNELHYLYGLVSLKLKNQNEFSAFTSLSSHQLWIERIMKTK